MSGKNQDGKPVARLPKGMRDIDAEEIRGVERMLSTIRAVYESYGFEPLDTPAFEYTDCLGKFLPDQDRPNEGVFSFQDEDEQWLSLRYDLTAPLARFVAQNFDRLPKPFRRYQTGPVWRNEKPGPGRFRQFTQFDADTVGTESIAADAELCMLAADTLEALGVPRGHYVIKVNHRKILDRVMAAIGLGSDENAGRRLAVLRTIDKWDKFGETGVRLLLGEGRKDESGAFTKGVGLNSTQINAIIAVCCATSPENLQSILNQITANTGGVEDELGGMPHLPYDDALNEVMEQFEPLVRAAGYQDRIRFDSSVVRGLEYYTGLVFEAELTFETKGAGGQAERFGSVGGGGRYDGLISRFRGDKVPATGFSVGVSRLYAALQSLGRLKSSSASGPVVILVMDRDRIGDYNRMAQTLRQSGIRAEVYLGTSGMKAQMKYADKRAAPCVVIQGSDEHARGEVTIKDLVEGERLSGEITDNQAWREGRPAQFSVKQDELVEAVRSVLARHRE